MAERRMFSKAVINSARFLTMPPSSRLLYYDLGMAADDDGVVEAFTVMRLTGAVEDDLKVLVSKGFIALLNTELVAYITDWSRNNQLRKDRYTPSIYKDLLVRLNAGDLRLTDGLPDGNQRLTQYSIDKGSSDKRSGGDAATPPRATRFVPPSLEEVREYCHEKGYQIDAERFVSYYGANGWRVGRNPMRSWKSAAQMWAAKDREEGKKHGKNQLEPILHFNEL